MDFLHKVRMVLCLPMAKAAGVLTATQYITTAIGFAMAIIQARLLGPSDYGTAILIMTYPTLLRSLIDIKSPDVTIRYIANYRGIGRTEQLMAICKLGYTLDFMGSLFAFIVIGLIFICMLINVSGMPDMAWLSVIYAAAFPLLSLRKTSSAVMISFGRFQWFSGFELLGEIVTFAIVLGLLMSGFAIPGMVLGTAAGHAIGGLMAAGAASYVLRNEIGSTWWTASLGSIALLRKELATLFGWNYLMVTLSGLGTQIPLILLGHLHGAGEAGFYRLAMSLVTAGSYLESSLGRIAYPVLSSRCDMGKQGQIMRTLKRWTLYGGLPAGALLILMVPVIPVMIPIVFGPSYNPMVSGTQVMMSAAAVSIVFFWLNSAFYATGRIDMWTKAYCIYTLLVLGLAWFCIERWGFSGLATLVGLSKVLFTVGMVYVFKVMWEKLS